jgi:hypothetical protein
MNRNVVLILAFFTLVATAQAAESIQNYDCNPGVIQNISPEGMGALQTIGVYYGSSIQLDDAQWRDAVTGDVPPVSFPGMSAANVTSGPHLLKISLKGFEDFTATVNICEHGLTEVTVQQVSIDSAPAVSGTHSPAFPPAATGTVPVPGTTQAPGFILITAITAIAAICILRKDSSG